VSEKWDLIICSECIWLY